MKIRHLFHLACLTSLASLLTACGGSSSTPPTPPAISVAFSSPAPTTLVASTTATLTATVSNDSANAGVTWSVTCSTAPCGTFSSASTASGAPTTYTAPSVAGSVTVVATSVTDKTKSVSATITITATAPVISVAFAPAPPASLVASTTTPLTAVVTNDSANAGVTWSVTCSTAPCGTFSPASTASGAPTTYQAPSAAETVTVTATSVTDKTKSASAMITVTTAPPGGIQVTFATAPPTSLALGSTASLTAVVTNDSANTGVNWTVTCGTGSTTCGSLNPTTTASNVATTFTAPTIIPTNGTVTVVATSVTDTTKSASATISITNTLGDGTYVFHVSGQDANSEYFIAGAFTVKGGLITGGEQDFLDSIFGQNDQFLPATSGIAITADGNIQITLATADTKVGVNGIETFSGSAVSPSRLLISESDTFAAGGGSVDLQTTVATPSGGYAFAVLGADNQQPQQPLGIGGVLRFNGTSLDSSANSVFDCNDGGAPALNQAFTGGSVTAPDAFGRVTITLNPSTACTLMQMVFGGYIIGPNQIQLVEAAGDTFNGTLGGTALGQGSNAGQFNTSSISNTSYVFSSFGADGNGTLTLAGGFTFNVPLAGNLALNDLSAAGGTTITGGLFAVDPTGRVTMTNVTTSGNNTLQFQLYLDGNGNALELGVDTLQLTSGMAYLQTTGAFPGPGNSVLLAQGFVPVSTTAIAGWSAAGPQTLTTNAFTGFVDYNVQGGTPTSNVAVNATVDTSTGLISLGGLDPNATSDNFGYYPIDASRVLAIEVDGNQLGLLQIEGVPTN